jgi:hypothetical protein
MASLQGRFLKEVTMFHMDGPSEAVPQGWALCDGTTYTAGQHDIGGGGASYTVPDLRNRFVLGADATKAAFNGGGLTNANTDGPGPKGSGGVHARTLTTTELPAHTHGGSTDSQGSHTHAGSTTDVGGAHSHTASETSAGSHAHSGSSTSAVAGHTHSGGSTGSAGSHSHVLTGNTVITSVSNLSIANQWNGGANVQIPANASGGTGTVSIALDGVHTHTVSIPSDGGHSHTVTLVADGTHTHTITVSSDTGHTHTFSVAAGGGHTHTVTTTSTGSGAAFDTRPRYYGIVFIIKIKN